MWDNRLYTFFLYACENVRCFTIRFDGHYPNPAAATAVWLVLQFGEVIISPLISISALYQISQITFHTRRDQHEIRQSWYPPKKSTTTGWMDVLYSVGDITPDFFLLFSNATYLTPSQSDARDAIFISIRIRKDNNNYYNNVLSICNLGWMGQKMGEICSWQVPLFFLFTVAN